MEQCSYCGSRRSPKPGAGQRCSNCGTNGFAPRKRGSKQASRKAANSARSTIIRAIADTLRSHPQMEKTAQGKPRVEAIERAMGKDVTAQERDEAWQLVDHE